MNIWKTLAIALLAAAPIAAQAQTPTGLYVGAGVGASNFQDQRVHYNGVPGKARESFGGLGTVSLGYAYGNGFRSEIQGDFRANETDRLGGKVARGSRDQFGAFINGFYDVSLPQNFGGLTPYVGAGVGYERVQLNRVRVPGFSSSASDGGVAVQGMVGTSYPIADVPGLAMTAEYRMTLMPHDMEFHAVAGGKSGTLRVDNALSHAGIIGVRYSFGASPASATTYPPVPMATSVSPAMARSFLVFFDWDKADLTARASQVVAEAAKASMSYATTRLDVAGHADRTGTAAYNQALSLKRANVVAAALVADGVARSAISVTAFGETKPLLPTADRVREPQNRRVEIVIR